MPPRGNANSTAGRDGTRPKGAAPRLPQTEEGWKAILTPEQYRVLRKGETEPPFTGKLLHNKGKGTYVCAGCGAALFDSEAKFDSGTGWPSFGKPSVESSLELAPDYSLGIPRTEVRCRRCGGHLGHLFKDSASATGLRYCINSCALGFRKK
jgi:peptide-methionine (R)-S-oxide reductase